VLVINLPGHLTHDSLTQIAEGRSGYVQSWNPIFSSWVFGTIAEWTGGIETIVAVSASILAASLYLMLAGAQTPGLWPLAPVALILFTPILLVHPGIVWKDVWFAHTALLGFGFTILRYRGTGWWVEVLALACFAMAMLTRQTGIVVAAIGACCLAYIPTRASAEAPTGAWRQLLCGALGSAVRLAVMMGLAVGLSALAKSQMKHIQINEVGTGLRLVAFFDMAGVLQRVPDARMNLLRSEGFQTEEWETAARNSFSSERIDRLDLRAMTGPRDLSLELILEQWGQLVLQHPLSYAAHRLETFAWFSGLRDQTRCIPIHVGVDVSPSTPTAGLQVKPARLAAAVYQWSRSFVDTPYFAPLAWNVVSLLVIAITVWRGFWRHPIVWLQAAGLAYSLSYLVSGFSCDFRYSYFSVAAASLGLMWLSANVSALVKRRAPESLAAPPTPDPA
jgi:hypothetical protein